MSQKKTPRELSTSERKRLHVAAMVTHEREWPQSEPNQGLARMFVIMLLVHVVVIGGVIVYDFVSEPTPATLTTTNSKKPAITAATTSTAATVPLPVVKDSPSEPAIRPLPTALTTATPLAPSPSVQLDSPESLLPAQFASTPVLLKDDSSKPMLTAPITQPDAVPAPVAKATKIESDPPEPVVAKRATIVTETSERPTSGIHTKSSERTTPKPTVVRRAEMVSPKPVATPSAARRELANDEKPAPKKHTVQDTPPAKKVATTGSKHTVAKGETIYSIARKFKVSEEALMKANGIKSANSLQIGKSLAIPAK